MSLDLEITYGQIRVKENELLNVIQARKELKIVIPKTRGYKTLIMYDNSAPYPNNNSNSPFLHYLVINVMDNVYDGTIVVDYLPPSPPANSEPHVYTWNLYEQREKQVKDEILERKRFNVEEYVKSHELNLMVEKNMRVTPIIM